MVKPPDNPRLAGILVPAFSARRKGDLGIGDTLAMRHMIEWAAMCRIGFLQLLPINEMGSEESPYSTISSAAIDPIYLTLDAASIPWLDEKDLESCRTKSAVSADSPYVDYPVVRKLKNEILGKAWRSFDRADGATRKAFLEFRKQEASWLVPYSEFKLLMEFFGNDTMWDEWPPECRSPVPARKFIEAQRERDPEAVDARLGYFAFVQWLCYRQWTDLFDYATSLSVRLMGDIPIGISWHSCDVFFHQDQFVPDWFGGTPAEPSADPFIRQWGQNWGIPLYNWDLMRQSNYAWWRTRIQRITRFFHMVRLDHILGFYRIHAFPWHPRRNHEFLNQSPENVARLTGGRLPRWFERPDDSDTNKAANLADGDPRLRAIVDAAGDTILIAEDLGWVPDYVRPHLSRLGIAGYRIPHWDCDPNGCPPSGDTFPELSFACYSTHDHDPVSGIWRGCVAAIRNHHQNPSDSSGWQADSARNTLRILSSFAEIPMPDDHHLLDFTEGVRLRLIKALMESNSRYACLMITSLFGLNERINEPGASNRQNWSFRLPWNTETMNHSPQLANISRLLRHTIQITGRSPTPMS